MFAWQKEKKLIQSFPTKVTGPLNPLRCRVGFHLWTAWEQMTVDNHDGTFTWWLERRCILCGRFQTKDTKTLPTPKIPF